jgi:hypothetical protein
MMVCLQCGYAEKRDWAKILLILSFVMLVAALTLSDFVPKHEVRPVAFAGFMFGIVGVMVSACRGLIHGRRHVSSGAREILPGSRQGPR